MHLYASLIGIDFGDVLELSQIEIPSQFAIDARQQIQVECCRHTQFVIIRREQLSAVLFQIRTQQKTVSRLQQAANFGKEIQRCRPIEVADCASQKKNQQ